MEAASLDFTRALPYVISVVSGPLINLEALEEILWMSCGISYLRNSEDSQTPLGLKILSFGYGPKWVAVKTLIQTLICKHILHQHSC